MPLNPALGHEDRPQAERRHRTLSTRTASTPSDLMRGVPASTQSAPLWTAFLAAKRARI